MAEIYEQVSPAAERMVIPAVREAYIQPFEASNWLDLRVGFFLSVTDNTNDEFVTGLAETITNPSGGLGPEDRYWIGVKTQEVSMPRTTGTVFMGYSNSTPAQLTNHRDVLGNSVLLASDITYLAGTDYWWPHNSHNFSWSAIVTDGEAYRSGNGINGVQQHFPNSGTVATAYTTLLGLRLTRVNVGGQARNITMRTKRIMGEFSTDILFSNTPTTELLIANLTSFPDDVATFGPVSLSRVPDAMYFYWPFENSRLRIHCLGVVKVR